MPFYKVSFVFKLADQGWTETYYKQADDAGGCVNLTVGQLTKFVSFRSDLTRLQAIRAIEVGGVRRGVVRALSWLNPGTLGAADVTGVTAQMKLSAFSGHNRILSVRGLADSSVLRDGSGGSTPTAALTNGLTDMMAEVVNQGYRIQFFTSQTKYSVLSLSPQTGNENITVVTLPAGTPVPAVGEQVRFFGYDRCILHNFNAPFRVLYNSATSFSIGYKWRLKDTSLSPALLQFAKVVYGYDIINQGTFAVFTTRKTGRPFGLSRGRIPARSCRR